MKNKKILHDTLILTAITLVAGLLLSVVYEITKEPIAKQEALAKQKAYQEVFADAASFEQLSDEAADSAAYLTEHGFDKQYIEETLTAKDASGAALGYVILTVTPEGYGGDIEFAIGVDLTGTIQGLSLLTINETAGLGMKAKEDSFRQQFAGIQADSISYTKSGKSAPNEIDAIGGATVTTSAITNGVNAALCHFQYLMEQNAPAEGGN